MKRKIDGGEINKNQPLNTIGNESELEKQDVKSEKNPYKYTGALDPVKDQLVCIPRTSDLNRVVDGIEKGEYWNILGSRQAGKTTVLRQIQNHFTNAYCIYITFDVSPKKEKNFYLWLMDEIREEIPSRKRRMKINRNLESKNILLDFLEKFQPQEDKKIIFLFDEIEGILFLKDFLDLWRSIHESRYNNKKFERYAIITAGSTNLIESTTGPTSPYNVAKDLYLQDFSHQESETLIQEPFNQLEIKIEEKAKQELISRLSGHPQMLQHACSKLVDIALSKGKSISGNDIADVLDLLTKENTTISILKTDLKEKPNLKKLAISILKGESNPFSLNPGVSIAGAGCIAEDENKCCCIRNQVFKKVIEDILQISLPPGEEDSPVHTKPRIFISYSHKDKKWKDLLSEHLKVLEPQETLFVWDDSKIKGGQDWYPEIEENMDSADAAIFLISKHSLTSKFILREEIPILLKRREEKEMILFPVLVGHCVWEKVPWLAKMQVRPKDLVPLPEGDPNQRDKWCVEIVEELVALLNTGTPIRKNEK